MLSDRKQARALILLCTLVYFCSYITRLDYGAVISEIVTSEGITKTQASLAQTGLFICYGLGQILSGFLGDIVPAQHLIFGGMLTSAAANLAVTFSGNYLLTAAFWCVNGFAQAMMWPPIVKIYSDYLNETEYSNGCVMVGFGSSFATVLIYLLGPVAVSLKNWRYLFWFAVVVAVACAFFWRFSYGKLTSQLPVMGLKKNSGTGKIASQPFTSAAVVMLLLMIVLVAFQGTLRDGVETWMPSYISESFSLSNSAAILSGVIMPLATLISRKVSASFFNKVKNELTCSLVFFGIGIVSMLGILTLQNSSPLFSVVLFALTDASMHGVNLMLTCMVPVRFRKFGRNALVAGILNAGTYLGSAVSMIGVAALATAKGWSAALVFWIGVQIAAVVLCLLLFRTWKNKWCIKEQ